MNLECDVDGAARGVNSWLSVEVTAGRQRKEMRALQTWRDVRMCNGVQAADLRRRSRRDAAIASIRVDEKQVRPA